jgi:hypothetical protein
MKRFQAFLSLGLIAVLAGCWASVDETEWCVKTRYGAIKEAGMPSGFQMINIVDDVTCFDVTERQFPPGDADAVMTATATTSDPLDVQVTYQIVVQLNVQNMEQTYIDKRHERQIERDLNGAIISGLQDAVAAWSMQGIFSDRRTELADSIGTHVDGKLGDMAEVRRVYVTNVTPPAQIEQARLDANEQENRLIEEQNRARVDSTQAWARVFVAQANLETERLNAEAAAVKVMEEADAYRSNPELLELRKIEAIAAGLGEACSGANTCVLGEGLLQRLLADLGR